MWEFYWNFGQSRKKTPVLETEFSTQTHTDEEKRGITIGLASGCRGGHGGSGRSSSNSGDEMTLAMATTMML